MNFSNQLFLFILGVLLIFTQTQCEFLNDEPNEPESDFAVKDTTNIIKFRISDTENNSITISRDNKDKKWMIEGTEYGAQPNNVKLIMETFYRIRVKQDLPEKAIENQLTSLSVQHKKVEIFIRGNNKPVKTWYIGGSTQDHQGTYMLLQNGSNRSSVPFIMYKPGFYGSLDVRFFTGLINWRASDVFHYPNPNDIQSVMIEFIDDNNESYTAIRNKDQSVSLINSLNQQITDFDSIQVKHYFTHFKGIFFNKVMQIKDSYSDSVFSIKPTYTIELKDIHGNTTLSEIWKIKYPLNTTDSNGNIIEWDPEYAYMRLNGANELLRIQYQNWTLLFKPLSFYIRNLNIK